jgi:DDE superfamily endonuclease
VAGGDLGEGTRLAAATGAYVCFEDEAGQNLRPPKARTWAPRGYTPVVTVSGKGSGRVSAAGLVCLRPGTRSHLFYRVRVHRGRKGERRSMSEEDYAGLITAAHQELKAPVILIWDRLNTHVSAVMRAFISSHPGWLTKVRLPAYAPDMNPVEGAWANMKNGLGNLVPVCTGLRWRGIPSYLGSVTRARSVTPPRMDRTRVRPAQTAVSTR